jgi:hypothetical protein
MRWSAKAALLAAATLYSPGAWAAGPRPYLSPWIVVRPGDARIEALVSHARAPLSPNAPGLLLDGSPGDDTAAESARMLVGSARNAGWRAGLSLTLQGTVIPEDARAAEAASAETLYPGLGRLLEAARGADLFVLRFPVLEEDLRAQSFVLKKVASEIRAANPGARLAVVPGRFLESPADRERARTLLSEENAAYVDLIGFRAEGTRPDPDVLRSAADAVVFGKPLFFEGETTGSPGELIALAMMFAPARAAYAAAAANFEPSKDVMFERLGALLSGDFGPDERPAAATAGTGETLIVARLVSGLDLGGVVLIPGVTSRGESWSAPLTLTLDSSSYSSVDITELSTGQSKTVPLPAGGAAPRLSLSTKNGPLFLRLTAREKTPAEATKSTMHVVENRGLTAEEILAGHQVWRARRDARWSRFIARDQTSIRFRFADLNNTFEETLAGPFFYEAGKGYDWAWTEGYFNGVRWRGRKIPQLPLVQPEKVSELPLALTFNDAYRYALKGEETVDGIRCWVLSFEPKQTVSDQPIYAGDVFLSQSDFAVIRTKARQLNLTGEVQSVDEIWDFGEVPAPDGGEPLRFPTHRRSQWILRTFSRTTVLENETSLSDIRIDPPTWDEEKKAAFASPDVMVRDTEKGVRYLERTKEGGRVVSENPKTSRLFGLGGVYYDSSLDFPLPLAGVYYLDLDFRKKHQQVQVFFAGAILAASFNEPRLFGTTLDAGADVFAIAVRGTNQFFVNGQEDESQRVKQRSVLANAKIGAPLGRHVKLSFTLGETHQDFGSDDKASPAFAVPSNNWITRLEGDVTWDLSGWAVSGRYAWNKRSRWEVWGLPGNPDYDSGKDEFRLWSVQIAKDFHLPGFQRIRTSASWLDSSNTDRFSKYSFGFFGPTSLRGFPSGSLRAEEAVIVRGAYGLVFGDTFRLEAIYEDARVKDRLAGYDWAYFSGAGISGEIPGPWSTIIRLDAGTPVGGRNRGQKGGVVSLVFLKIFP